MSGVPLQSAVSAGVAEMGDWHGGAIEEAAKMLQGGVAIKGKREQQIEEEILQTKSSRGNE